MNCLYKIFCSYIINKVFTFYHWRIMLSDTDNSNSTIVTTLTAEKCLS